MMTAPELTPDAPRNSEEGGVTIQCQSSPDSFLWRQLRSAGLEAIAEKIVAGRDLELDEALALSRASLPLLGKIVELRPVNSRRGDSEPAASLPIDRAVASPESTKNIGQPLANWESFCRTLLATRDALSRDACLDEAVTAWYPVLNKPLDQDHGSEGNFSGVEVLRAIALARLILPAEIEVRALLASLGPKVAQVALDFGASHLGCVALDGQPPLDPLVADAGLLDELLGSISRTEIKAPADPASAER